jgi:hypothetical protein
MDGSVSRKDVLSVLFEMKPMMPGSKSGISHNNDS